MRQRIGAQYCGNGTCEFRIWAPLAHTLSVNVVSHPARSVPMKKDANGFFSAQVDHIGPGDKYVFSFDGTRHRPDPVSYFQPEDIMGPSCIVDHSAFSWRDNGWAGIPVEKMIIYELHVGTFTQAGSFEGVISKLPYLQELGINTVEIMPVAQFPGPRNWGYDGVYPFAVQHSYGGPDGLKALVNECHCRNMSVILDVVYNHLGPEGNFLAEFMPCFSEKYKTPWGRALNFDDRDSWGVRDFFIQNALYWFERYHIDGLRLDAIHGIFDMGARHILRELSEEVDRFDEHDGRKHYLIAESDLNDVRVIEPFAQEGYGLDAQWNDDFHHCLHTLLTGESRGYYADFGSVAQMAKAVQEGFVYSWDYSPFRRRFHGSSSKHIPASQFVVFSQNHDQVGNRMKGERLSVLADFEALKAAAGLELLLPAVPLLFMGEEYAEDAPFLYFASFHDENLIAAVREGRKKEFASFDWKGEPPDPFDENTFLRSKLQWDKSKDARQRVMLDYYKRLIRLRQDLADLGALRTGGLTVHCDETKRIIAITRSHENGAAHIVVNFNKDKTAYAPIGLEGEWHRVLDSSEAGWLGPGSDLPEAIRTGSECMCGPLCVSVYMNRL